MSYNNYNGGGGGGGNGYICRQKPCRPSYPNAKPAYNNYKGSFQRSAPTYRPHAPEKLPNKNTCSESKGSECDPSMFLPKKNELHTPACAHIKSLYNPFEQANANPKWPDGLATYSVGMRHLESREVSTLIEDDDNRTDFLIMLFPGTANWCVVINQVVGNKYSLAGVLGTNTSFNWAYDSSVPNHREWNINSDAFSAWRGVSYAMKMCLISPSETREGYYEAIRVDRATFQTQWGITTGNSANNNADETKGGAIKLYPGYALPSGKAAADHYNGVNWQLNPTYTSGNLKLIDKNVFMLNPSKTQNEFTNLRKVVHDADTVTMEDIFADRYAAKDGTPQTGNLFSSKLAVPKYHDNTSMFVDFKSDQETLISDAFDMILVRIHSTNAKLMISTVANHEFLVRETSSFAQYSTPAYADREALDKYIWGRKKFHRLPVHNETHALAFGKAMPLEK